MIFIKTACILECRLEKALANMTDDNKCIPWYFPRLDPDIRMCSPFEGKEFKNNIDVMATTLCQVRN